MKGLVLCAVQTFGLEINTDGNGTIVAQALNYWQALSSNGGGVAVGVIVEVGLDVPYEDEVTHETRVIQCMSSAFFVAIDET